MKKVFTMVVALSVFLCSGCTVIKRRTEIPQIWTGGHYPFQLVDADPDEYDETFSKITGLNIFCGDITGSSLDDLRPLAELLCENNIKVSIEVGGLYNHVWADECGERSAEIDLATLNKWRDAGGTVDRLFMDEAIGRVTSVYGSGWGSADYPYLTYEEAGNEMADYISAVRAIYPDIEIYLGTNFPNWGWKGEIDFYGRGEDGMFRGDYYIALTDFLDTVDARGEKIDGVEVDNPYEYYTGKGSADDEIDWAARLADLENVVKSRGLKFNIIINSEGGNTSPLLFYFYTMEYIKMYLGNGGAPDTITVESWYTYPDKTLPESERNTLFRTACDVYDFTENFYYEKTGG